MNDDASSDDIKKFVEDSFHKNDRAIKMTDESYGYKPSFGERVSSFLRCKIFHNFLKHTPSEINTVEDYMKLPSEQRTYMGWYLTPYSLEYKRNKLVGWKQFDVEIKKLYPVQFFIRETIFGQMSIQIYIWKRKWFENVICRISPRQKWLTNQIPNTWCDKRTLIQLVNFAMVVDYVDGEKCFDVVDYESDQDPKAIEFATNLRLCYNFIKVELPALEKKHGESYPTEENQTGDYFVDYENVNRLEKQISEETERWLTWIVANREYFWT